MRRAATKNGGRGHGRRRGSGGFTLVEIMVVVIVLGILAGALIPNLAGSAETVRLDAAAHQVADLLDYCYHAASSSGRVHGLIFDTDRRAFQVVAEIGPGPGEPARFDAPAELEPVSVPGLMTRKLPDGVMLESVDVFEDDLVKTEDDLIRILFFPDGTTEFATLNLIGPSGEIRAVDLNGFSGTISISRPERSDEETEEGGAE